MKIYKYIEANSGWIVLCPYGAYQLPEIEQWCRDTYSAEEHGSRLSDASLGYSWFVGGGEFAFKNESDASMFILRWSGAQ